MPELELLRAMAEADFAPIETLRDGIPRRLADAMRRGLARDPSERTLTAAEMVEVLRAQADMEVAHGDLIAVLERVKRSETRGTVSQHAVTPATGLAAANPPSGRWHFPTPRSMTVSRVESLTPVERISAAPPPPSRFGRFVPFAAGLGAVAILGLSFEFGRSLSAQSSASAEDEAQAAPPPLVLTPPPPAAAPSPATAVASPAPLPASPPSPTTGMLLTPAAARHHRVWIDGQLAAYAAGGALHVPCGAHVVRIGSGGAAQAVRVPCGGEVAVEMK